MGKEGLCGTHFLAHQKGRYSPVEQRENVSKVSPFFMEESVGAAMTRPILMSLKMLPHNRKAPGHG